MTTSDSAAGTMPVGECSAVPPATPARERTASTVTYAARAKNDSAMTRSAVRSRASYLVVACGELPRHGGGRRHLDDRDPNLRPP